MTDKTGQRHRLVSLSLSLRCHRAFCANLLQEDQHEVSDLFAGRMTAGAHSGRFDHTAWSRGELGQPILEGATASFQCRVATSVLWETHHIIVGNVVSVGLSGNAGALLYGQRAYHRAVQLSAIK